MIRTFCVAIAGIFIASTALAQSAAQIEKGKEVSVVGDFAERSA